MLITSGYLATYECSQAATYECSQAATYECSQAATYECSQAATYECSQVATYECSQVATYECSQVFGLWWVGILQCGRFDIKHNGSLFSYGIDSYIDRHYFIYDWFI